MIFVTFANFPLVERLVEGGCWIKAKHTIHIRHIIGHVDSQLLISPYFSTTRRFLDPPAR